MEFVRTFVDHATLRASDRLRLDPPGEVKLLKTPFFTPYAIGWLPCLFGRITIRLDSVSFMSRGAQSQCHLRRPHEAHVLLNGLLNPTKGRSQRGHGHLLKRNTGKNRRKKASARLRHVTVHRTTIGSERPDTARQRRFRSVAKRPK